MTLSLFVSVFHWCVRPLLWISSLSCVLLATLPGFPPHSWLLSLTHSPGLSSPQTLCRPVVFPVAINHFCPRIPGVLCSDSALGFCILIRNTESGHCTAAAALLVKNNTPMISQFCSLIIKEFLKSYYMEKKCHTMTGDNI